MDLQRKLAILADAAKYDASCASSGARGRTAGKDGLGSVTGAGICHSYTPDGRCVSLLKILLTNVCLYDCAYCVNRRSSDVERARFSVDEVVRLTLDFYRRNYIEGLFLSSGIIRSSDYTMEQLVRVARTLRREHRFRGYIHLKTIPEADPELVEEAGRWADRLSINVELPSQRDLDRLAPEKRLVQIETAMGDVGRRIAENRARAAAPVADASRPRPRRRERFAPAGQSTQMVVGATDATDADVLGAAGRLYRAHRLRRVYYSAFSPIPAASARLPLSSPPLLREHRLYQADWLFRFYGFEVDELAPADAPRLRLEMDPKLAWALRHRERFPVDVNRADREALLRVPGLGVRNARRILASRRHRRIRLDHLRRLQVRLDRALPFIVAADHRPGDLDVARLEERLMPSAFQTDLFHRYAEERGDPTDAAAAGARDLDARGRALAAALGQEALAAVTGEL
ncbi:MAG: putative DNA modification/repair radical SAM protein [Rhodothermales bacterium]|nr:putative DNA modification/repair radical SAM protein [Rhodothermales bacterium]